MPGQTDRLVSDIGYRTARVTDNEGKIEKYGKLRDEGDGVNKSHDERLLI